MKLLITGGTGSFGKALVRDLLTRESKPERIVVFSRDELKQWEMQQEYPKQEYPELRFFLGDIRDKERLNRALENIDTVVHAAALKQVPAAEYNPMEFIKTNILGAENLIQAALDKNVRKVVALSTDKAAAPVNLYGATKLCSDKLFIAANNIAGSRDVSFSVVRYGNVMGSRGSVIPVFMDSAKKGVLRITDERMTRFNITLEDGVKMVRHSIRHSQPGDILIPKIPSYSLDDLADAIGPNCERVITGIRPGEKLHEEMITSSDSFSTIDTGDYYVITHQDALRKNIKNNRGERVREGFAYNSGSNTSFLGVEEIRSLIRAHVCDSFEPI
jgi:UDP-N-acetylglucosamine 4,6-dehydratase